MSLDLEQSNLRWARFDGVYYAAILVRREDAPAEVPEGQEFVYFLDGETGSILDATDVLPFDLSDSEKVHHPAAAAGVEVARGIIEGTSSAANADDPTYAGGGDDAYAKMADLEAELEDENGDLLSVLPRKEKKQKEKREKKEKKHKKHKKHRHDSDEAADASDDSEAGGAVVKKEKKTKRRRERSSDDENDGEGDGKDDLVLLQRDDMAARGKKEKRKASRKKIDDSSDSADSSDGEGTADEERDDDDDDDAPTRKARTKATKVKNEADHWSGFAEEYGFGDDDDDETVANAVFGGVPRRGGGHRGGGGGGLMSMALSALNSRSSPVVYYRPQIKHMYLTIRQEAMQSNKIVSAYESAIERAVESRLRQVQMEMLLLNQALQDDKLSRHERVKLRDALEKLQQDGSVNVEAIARSVVTLRDPPPPARDHTTASGAADPVEEPPRRHKLSRRVSVFQDPVTAVILKDASSQAEQRDMASDAVQRYREQLLRRQQVTDARRTSIAASVDASAQRGRPSSSTHFASARTHLDMFFQSREAAALAAGSATPAEGHSSRLSASVGGTQQQQQGTQAQASPGLNDYGLRFMTNTSGTSTSFLGAGSFGQGESLNATQQGGGLTMPATSSRPHHMRPTAADDALNLFNSATATLRQSRSAAMIPAFYSFDNFMTGAQPAQSPEGNDIFRGLMTQSQSQQGGGGGASLRAGPGDVLQISPMHLDFDQRAAFALHSDEDGRQDASTMHSSMVSAPYNMESQPSLWYGGAESAQNSVAVASARGAPSSRASSVGHGGRHTGKSANDWRAGAKRAILEALTLYYRGLRGRPQVLDLEDVHTIAKLLLHRAVRQEAQRQGLSMALKSANHTAPFTDEVKASIKKSVETYVQRNYVNKATGGSVDRQSGSAVKEGRQEDEEDTLHEKEGSGRHHRHRDDAEETVAAADDDIEYQ